MQQHVTDDQEISLRDIWGALMRQRWVIVLCVFVAGVIGLLYAVFTQPLYTATVTVQPVSEEKAGSLGSIASQFGGLASMAGINLGAGGSSTLEYIAILKSREFGERFIEEQDLKPHLFPEEWDSETGEWRGSGNAGTSPEGRSQGGFRSWLSGILVSLSGDEGYGVTTHEGPGPSMWDAYKQFTQNIRSVQEDAQTGMVTVSFRFRNPRLVADWANAYVAMANNEIRMRTIAEAERALEYLNREVDRTQAAGIRETIYALVETQLERIMLAQARDEYAFKVIDQAVVPEERSHPRRALIVLLSLVLGGMVGAFVALIREAWRR